MTVSQTTSRNKLVVEIQRRTLIKVEGWFKLTETQRINLDKCLTTKTKNLHSMMLPLADNRYNILVHSEQRELLVCAGAALDSRTVC